MPVALTPRRTLLLRAAPALVVGGVPAHLLGPATVRGAQSVWIPLKGPEALLKSRW
ncbi:hypothetical protein ACWGH8_27435 [Nonomuraea muscovyensis]|uniref:Uncharacterized protein n=1 Tax=Nonomuraea muscovyensis TaxID=1124761 RepID=A0A7X0C7H9_9ACTN|nr:hypothetical protein [Nonomuraea muscovyensis]MBB6348536.1 hypothetical protein [Nonomuraea muscovyensis]